VTVRFGKKPLYGCPLLSLWSRKIKEDPECKHK
jgi:hypothetical protein